MRGVPGTVVCAVAAIGLIVGAPGCYPFEIADFPDAAADGGDWPCEPGWAGAECEICARFVRADGATDGADGLTWSSAFPDVIAGIEAAAAALAGGPERCEVWVAGGTYYVYRSANADTVQLRPGVALYGGFTGHELEREARDWALHRTLLDGRDGPDGAHQVYHVVTGADDAVLDGFEVVNGNADRGTDPMDPNNWGGGMINFGCSPTVRNCVFAQNRAYFGAGMENIKVEDGDELIPAAPSIIDCLFTENWASGVGGAMDNDYSSPTIENTDFVGNHADLGGGAINNMYGSPQIDGCRFSANFTSDANGANGGALMNWSEAPEIRNSEFIDNWAWSGGAIVNESSSPIIEDCVFDSNAATEAGGAIANITAGPEIRGCTLVANAVDEYGGALANLDGSTPLIEDNRFLFNQASDGGGIFNGQSTATIRGSTFVQNLATWGAGVSNLETTGVQIEDCRFTSNHAVQGGGAIDDWVGDTVTDRSIFAGNSAAVGGAVYLSGAADVRLASCLFFDNRAGSGGGGALRSRENSVAEVANGTLVANRAGEPGGAILTESSSSLTLVNSVARDNLPDEVVDETLGVTSIAYTDIEGGASGAGNLDLDPVFAGYPWHAGVWSAVVYDEDTRWSTLTDDEASWEIGELVGMLVSPHTGEHLVLEVLQNDATSLIVWGDLAELVEAGDDYAITDLRLGAGTPCSDAADGAAAPALDLDGRVRINLPEVVDTGVGEPAWADLGAYEYYPANLFGPDEFGYLGLTDDDLSACADISVSGTSIIGLGDDASVEVALGFGFSFYGVTEDLVTINSNGLLTFGGAMPNSFVNSPLPSGVLPAILPHWDDLDPTFGGGVYYLSAGTLFTVQWALPVTGDLGEIDVRAVLDGTSGEIHFCYVDTDAGDLSDGVDATAGIQGGTPLVALQYSYNQPRLVSGLHIRFVPPS